MEKKDIHYYKEHFKSVYKEMMVELGLLDLDVKIWSNEERIKVDFDMKV